jgi:16S rRNA (adenine1518-N6/adenine1519-N6)-dimethyltransferase
MELGGRDRLQLVHADLAQLSVARLRADLGVDKIKLAGNLPYQLTSRVLFGVLDLEAHLEDAVFMVQREVAERIVASPGSRDYGILSVLLHAFHDVSIVVRVKPGSFLPAPRVESSLIRIVPRAAPAELEWGECADLVHLVKSVFNQRRKVLRNTLKRSYALEADDIAACEAASGVDLGRRPETLDVGEFVRLLRTLPGRSASEVEE